MDIVFLKTNELNSNDDFNDIQNIIKKFDLPLSLSVIDIDKADNKTLKRHHNDKPLLFLDKGNLTLAILDNDELIKVSPNWQSYQSRIVKAGKNSELLLKIAKLNKGMSVIDGTAGFGIDGLILASTGATVTLIEQNPLLFLMLMCEKNKMSQNPNWQKLLSRITLQFGNSGDILNDSDKVYLIYLDPMFPSQSYKSAVNKNMQVLHSFIAVPTSDDESSLFNTAIKKCHSLIIKRPINAPNFGDNMPILSVNNDVIRFDRYEGVCND